MTPLPVNPTVVILVDDAGRPAVVASNVAPLPELNVTVTNDVAKFDEESKGKPFRQVVQ